MYGNFYMKLVGCSNMRFRTVPRILVPALVLLMCCPATRFGEHNGKIQIISGRWQTKGPYFV